jgi:hypothetical protein
MKKFNFLSEGNSLSNFDAENSKENYYQEKRGNTINKGIDDINYYYSELNKKNKQIIELKSIILNYKKTQENLLKEIKSLQYKLSNSKKRLKNEEHLSKEGESQQNLLLKIKILQNENEKLKKRINNDEEKENNFYNNINSKLLKAERDIQLLSFENKNNNNIILAIQNFLFNINDKINSENQNLIFDLSLIDNSTFIYNLQLLESSIINKLNQLSNIGNMCLYNSRNHNKNYIDYDNYNRSHYTIIGNNDSKIKNIKKIIKQKNQMKTINNINSQNKKIKKKISFGLFYNNFFDGEKQKINKPLKAYSLRNNYLKEFGSNDDICFEDKAKFENNGKVVDAKNNNNL